MNSALALTVVLVTTALFAMAGLWAAGRRRLSLEDYTVGRNRIGGALTLSTVVASVAGAWILFSPAEAATWAGIAGLAGYAVGQAAPLAALGLLGPRMRRLMPRGHSHTEFAWHRYGRLVYGVTLLIMLFYMFVFLAAELTGISLALQLVADVPLVLTAVVVAVGTLAYTSYGGIRASIRTDGIQFALIIPLLIVVFLATLSTLGGFGTAMAPAREAAPQLFSLGHRPGVAFGFTLVIAILAANLFHQGFWQRVYACRDAKVLRRSYLAGALVVIPLILLSGVFGLLAVGQGVPPEEGSVALFSLAADILPTGPLMLLLVLALALVMSSMDTLLNGIVSVVTVDLARLRPGRSGVGLLRSSRWLTVVIAVPAVFVASFGWSVLYLFLLADLVCSAAAFPLFYGLYVRRFSGAAALTSILAGLATGVLFFPRPDFSPWFNPSWLNLHHDFQFLASFGSALLVSVFVAVTWNLVAILRADSKAYDFQRLTGDVSLIEG